MKRERLIKHLRAHGCELLREGKKHSLFRNPANGNISTVPRHTEIKNPTAAGICKALDVPILRGA